MRQKIQIEVIGLLLLAMSLSPINANTAHVIYQVQWTSEESGIVQLKWSDPEIRTPIMIQSWSQSVDGEMIIRYATGNDVPSGFSDQLSKRKIQSEGLKTPFRIILLEANKSTDHSVFSDMPLNEEGKKSIRMLYDLGVLNGYSDGTIQPQKSVSRAEFSKMLYMATEMSPESSTGFVDVATNHWAKEYIHTLASKGIVQGKGGGRFDPNGTITIGELATILSRTFTLYNEEEAYPYTSNGHWSFDYFNRLVSQGVIVQNDDFYYPYQAEQLATRQDCAVLLSRILLEYHEVVR